MGKISRKRIFKKMMNDVGHDAGKVALRLSYPVTGAFPARSQKWLERKFRSYNAKNATVTSGACELVGSTIVGLAISQWDTNWFQTYVAKPNPVVACVTVLASVYGMGEGAARLVGASEYRACYPCGSFGLKILTAPAAYFYDKWKSAEKELEKETG